MATAVRYVVTSPATSRTLRDALQEAINRGDRTISITAESSLGDTKIEFEFILERNRYNEVGVQYSGQIAGLGFASVTAFTHPDMADEPATLAFIRRHTP